MHWRGAKSTISPQRQCSHPPCRNQARAPASGSAVLASPDSSAHPACPVMTARFSSVNPDIPAQVLSRCWRVLGLYGARLLFERIYAGADAGLSTACVKSCVVGLLLMNACTPMAMHHQQQEPCGNSRGRADERLRASGYHFCRSETSTPGMSAVKFAALPHFALLSDDGCVFKQFYNALHSDSI